MEVGCSIHPGGNELFADLTHAVQLFPPLARLSDTLSDTPRHRQPVTARRDPSWKHPHPLTHVSSPPHSSTQRSFSLSRIRLRLPLSSLTQSTLVFLAFSAHELSLRKCIAKRFGKTKESEKRRGHCFEFISLTLLHIQGLFYLHSEGGRDRRRRITRRRRRFAAIR